MADATDKQAGKADSTVTYPYIESFALVGANAWQGIKWYVNKEHKG